MNVVTVEPCPLKKWRIDLKVRFDKSATPDRTCWPCSLRTSHW